jgi:quinol-cytochrome oxidoreductase complex cytochrome b subunit
LAKKKLVPLVKISGDASIYYDFEKNVPYIQHFKGSFTESAGNSYSKGGTFWLGQAILGGTAFLGMVLDAIFKFPVVISVVIAIFLGLVLGNLFIKITITNSLGEKEYRKITKEEVSRSISNSKSFWVLRIAVVFMVLGLLLMLFIQISNNKFKGKDFIILTIGIFAVVGITEAVHPKQGLKARKILKKQLKEGKFDD